MTWLSHSIDHTTVQVWLPPQHGSHFRSCIELLHPAIISSPLSQFGVHHLNEHPKGWCSPSLASASPLEGHLSYSTESLPLTCIHSTMKCCGRAIPVRPRNATTFHYSLVWFQPVLNDSKHWVSNSLIWVTELNNIYIIWMTNEVTQYKWPIRMLQHDMTDECNSLIWVANQI